MRFDEVVLKDGSVVLLAGPGVRDANALSGNPWHDPRTGKFANAPPGMKVLRGAALLASLPGPSKWQIEEQRRKTPGQALSVDLNGDKARVRIWNGKHNVGVVDVPLVKSKAPTRRQVEKAFPELEWRDPPSPVGKAGERKAGGYSADQGVGTNTDLGRLGERAFVAIAGGRILHEPGKGEQSPLDVEIGDHGFEVKAVSRKSTSYKATPKPYEVAQKEQFADERGLKPALAIVVVDTDGNEAHAYYREGLKGGRLSEKTGWKYMGSTSLDTLPEQADLPRSTLAPPPPSPESTPEPRAPASDSHLQDIADALEEVAGKPRPTQGGRFAQADEAFDRAMSELRAIELERVQLGRKLFSSDMRERQRLPRQSLNELAKIYGYDPHTKNIHEEMEWRRAKAGRKSLSKAENDALSFWRDNLLNEGGERGFPIKIGKRWLKENVPNLTQDEVNRLVQILRDRGWTDDRIAEQLSPYRDMRDHRAEMDARLTVPWRVLPEPPPRHDMTVEDMASLSPQLQSNIFKLADRLQEMYANFSDPSSEQSKMARLGAISRGEDPDTPPNYQRALDAYAELGTQIEALRNLRRKGPSSIPHPDTTYAVEWLNWLQKNYGPTPGDWSTADDKMAQRWGAEWVSYAKSLVMDLTEKFEVRWADQGKADLIEEPNLHPGVLGDAMWNGLIRIAPSQGLELFDLFNNPGPDVRIQAFEALDTVVHEGFHVAMRHGTRRQLMDEYQLPAGAFVEEALNTVTARHYARKMLEDAGYNTASMNLWSGPLLQQMSYPRQVEHVHRYFMMPLMDRLMHPRGPEDGEPMDYLQAEEYTVSKLREVQMATASTLDRFAAMDDVLRAHGINERYSEDAGRLGLDLPDTRWLVNRVAGHDAPPPVDYVADPDMNTRDRIQQLFRHGLVADIAEAAARLVEEDEAKYPGVWEKAGYSQIEAADEYKHEIRAFMGNPSNTTDNPPLPSDFPRGLYEPDAKVKFWPYSIGHYSGWAEARGGPFWKALMDSNGNELAFWFSDPNGLPHHEHMAEAMGVKYDSFSNAPDNALTVAGYGPDVTYSDGEHAWGVAIAQRHRKDIKDAGAMTMAAANSKSPEVELMRKLDIGALAVGGAVRDELYGKEQKDVDFVVPGVTAEELKALLEPHGGVEDLIVADRLVGVRFHPDDKLVPGGIEVVPTRREISTGEGHQDFDIVPDPSMTVEQDMERRDFTINAMARDVKTGELIDPYGGEKDLADRVLRTVSKDSFRDDPLRIIRGLRFVSQLGLTADPDTKEQMRTWAPGVANVSGERIRMELDKLLLGKNPKQALELARETGVLRYMLPEVQDTVGFDQQSKYHDMQLDDHILSVVQAATDINAPLSVRLAALFHDTGKPESAWMGEDGRLHYYANPAEGKRAHETIGAEKAREALTRMAYPNDVRDEVVAIIEGHMFNPKSKPKDTRKWISSVGRDRAHLLLAHRRADFMGKDEGGGESLAKLDEFEKLVRQEMDQPLTIKELKINGKDLIGMGMKPGPEMGQVLNQLLRDVLGDPSKNDHDWLMRRAAKISGAGLPAASPADTYQNMREAEQLIQDLNQGDGFSGNPEGVKALYMPDPRDAIATELDLNNAPTMETIETAKAIVYDKSQAYLREKYPDGQVTLYRGGEGFREDAQPFLAWTPNRRKALVFARGDENAVRERTVPISAVIAALPALHPGGYDEEEYLLAS